MNAKAQSKGNFRQLVNTPAELAANFALWYDGIQTHPGIPWGIPMIDEVVIPMRPGDLVGLIARPGHGKSSLMAYLARAEAKRIIQRNAVGKEVVVYVTWESSAEEIETFFISDGEFSATDIAWGRVPQDTVTKKLLKRAGFPVWTIGHSIARAGQPVPRMTLPAVLGAIESMEADFGVKPVLLLFDYLQLIPIEGANTRVEQVLEAPPRIKELALRIGAPAVCGVQASRDVDTLKIKIPQPHHCQWGSSIEQAADKLFGLWMPWKTEDHNAPPIDVAGKSAVINEYLLILQLLKQRMASGRASFPLYFAPQYLKLAQLEILESMKHSDFGYGE